MAIEITSESLAGAQPEPADAYKGSPWERCLSFQVAASVVRVAISPNKYGVDPTQL